MKTTITTQRSTSLYAEITAAGIPHDSHASDLYLPDTPQVRKILGGHPLECSNARCFTIQAGHKDAGQRWIDVPFAFLPYWEARQKRSALPLFVVEVRSRKGASAKAAGLRQPQKHDDKKHRRGGIREIADA